MKFKITKAIIAGTVLSLSSVVTAGLIQADYTRVNDKLAVYDTATGLTWLDTTVTAGMGYVEAGAAFSGWRYATNTEVETLIGGNFTDPYYEYYGIATERVSGTVLWDEIVHFSEMFGIMNNSESAMFYFDENNIGKLAGVQLTSNTLHRLIGPDYYNVNTTTAYDGHAYYGIFMVKETETISNVPEPSTLAIFGLGLMGVGLRHRRKVNVAQIVR